VVVSDGSLSLPVIQRRLCWWPAGLEAEEKDRVIFFASGADSSILPDATSFDKRPIILPMQTLDGFMEDCPSEVPILLKLDVQGFELEVLRGGRNTLRCSDFVIMETSLLPYNSGGPLLTEVIVFMGIWVLRLLIFVANTDGRPIAPCFRQMSLLQNWRVFCEPLAHSGSTSRKLTKSVSRYLESRLWLDTSPCIRIWGASALQRSFSAPQ
jgi:hypothetical protein